MVSLGADCGAANLSKQWGYRAGSYPFDWSLSLDSEAVIEILQDDFRHFLDPQFLVAHSGGLLIHTHYHIIFSHEGDWKGGNHSQKIGEFRERFQRRIARFRDLSKTPSKVFFMRTPLPPYEHLSLPFPSTPLEMSRDYSIRLKRALESFFPDLNFALIIVNSQIDGNVQIEDNLFIFKDLKELYRMLAREEMCL